MFRIFGVIIGFFGISLRFLGPFMNFRNLEDYFWIYGIIFGFPLDFGDSGDL